MTAEVRRQLTALLCINYIADLVSLIATENHIYQQYSHMTEGFPWPRSMADPLASAYLAVVNNESDLVVFLCYCRPYCWRMLVILHSMA